MSAVLGTPKAVGNQGLQGATIASGLHTKLVVKVFGGPIGMLQAALFDVNNVQKNGTTTPLDTGATGQAEWEFLTTGFAGGYLRWRVVIEASAANLGAYHVVEEIWQNDAIVQQAQVDGVLPGGQMLTSFVNSVLIR